MFGSENISPNQETTTWQKDSRYEPQKRGTHIFTEGGQVSQQQPQVLGSEQLGQQQSHGLGSGQLGQQQPQVLGSGQLGQQQPQVLGSGQLGQQQSHGLGTSGYGYTSHEQPQVFGSSHEQQFLGESGKFNQQQSHGLGTGGYLQPSHEQSQVHGSSGYGYTSHEQPQVFGSGGYGYSSSGQPQVLGESGRFNQQQPQVLGVIDKETLITTENVPIGRGGTESMSSELRPHEMRGNESFSNEGRFVPEETSIGGRNERFLPQERIMSESISTRGEGVGFEGSSSHGGAAVHHTPAPLVRDDANTGRLGLKSNKDENVEKDNEIEAQKQREREMELEIERERERERERGHEIIEIIGENYLSQGQHHTGLEHRGMLMRSSTVDSSTNIRYVICGPHALEACGFQDLSHALINESICQVKISKRSEHNEIKFIPKGYALCWEFILQSHDIWFSLKQKLKGNDNQIIQQAIIDRQTYEAGEKIQGKCECENDTSVILVWDNSYSKFTSKNVNFRMTLVNLHSQMSQNF